MANASLSGANTVNGPGPDRVSARPAFTTRSTKVVAPIKKTKNGEKHGKEGWKDKRSAYQLWLVLRQCFLQVFVVFDIHIHGHDGRQRLCEGRCLIVFG